MANRLKELQQRFRRARGEPSATRRANALVELLDALEADRAAAGPLLFEEVVEALEATERLLAEQCRDEPRVTTAAPCTLQDVEAVVREFALAPKAARAKPRPRRCTRRSRRRGAGRPAGRRVARGDPSEDGEPASSRSLREAFQDALSLGERWRAAAIEATEAIEFWRASAARWRALAAELQSRIEPSDADASAWAELVERLDSPEGES